MSVRVPLTMYFEWRASEVSVCGSGCGSLVMVMRPWTNLVVCCVLSEPSFPLATLAITTCIVECTRGEHLAAVIGTSATPLHPLSRPFT